MFSIVLSSLIILPFVSDIFKEGIWKDTAAFGDPCLQGLTSRLQKSVLSARVPATTDVYHRAFKKWKIFASSKLKASFLPASPIDVALYLQHLLESTKSTSSIDSACYAIKWAHEVAGMSTPTDGQVVSRVRDAAKRVLGPGRPNRKEPLTIEVLKDVIEKADFSNILQLRNVCLYVLAYAGFFRSEEVLHIRMNHICFREGYMIMKVEKSKTDQLRQGDEVVIAQSGARVCPVSLLQAYLRKLDIDPNNIHEKITRFWLAESSAVQV